MTARKYNCRKIVERWIIEGQLRLDTPAHLGNGDSDELTDMPLLVDDVEGAKRPLLTGASLAGALRAYLGEWECGYDATARYGARPDMNSWTVKLFGVSSGEDDGEQSRLIVEDALGKAEAVERRHGVGIDRRSRTAKHQRLYDMLLWPIGTTFKLRLELLICQDDDSTELRKALATALQGLSNGGITLGMRKQRGFGRVCVKEWRVRGYNLCMPGDLFEWIEQGADPLSDQLALYTDIKQALNIKELLQDKRAWFSVEGEFSLDQSSLLIRTEGLSSSDPDMRHLHAHRPGNPSGVPVLSGTSLTGALRARACKIVNTLTNADKKTLRLTENIFGSEDKEIGRKNKKRSQASRLHVREHVIQQAGTDLVQHRVSIDRFTGGALPTALFNQQAAIGLPGTVVILSLWLRAPENHEIGLLLLLMKDLWTSDLPLGGESSVGRGRLQGQRLTLGYHTVEEQPKYWNITAASKDALQVSGEPQQQLEDFVDALQTKLQAMIEESNNKESRDE